MENQRGRVSLKEKTRKVYSATQVCRIVETTFVRTGRPAAKDVPNWHAYNQEDWPTMRIDTDCQVINNRFKDEVETWRAIGKL